MDAPSGPGNRSWVSITVVTTTLSMAFTAVCLRFYTRGVLLKQLGIDDYVMLVALSLAIACGIAITTNINYGLGRHTGNLDPPTIKLYLRTFYVSIVMYNATILSIKLTFLLQYYRVLAVHKMKTVIIVATVLIMCWSVSQLLVATFNCSPIPKFWDDSISGSCIPNYPFWYINAAGNIATDVAIFVMPLPVLGKLNLRKAQKIMLMGIFSLGFFTCAISVVRIEYLHQAKDFTWENVASSSWSIGEVSSGIVCACLPTLRPFILKYKPHWMGHYGQSKYGSKGYKGYAGHHEGKEATHSSAARTSTTAVTARSGSEDQLYYGDLEAGNARLSSVRDATDILYDRDFNVSESLPASPNTQEKAEQTLGLRSTVSTKIMVGSTPPPSDSGAKPGIEVKKDIVLEESSSSRR